MAEKKNKKKQYQCEYCFDIGCACGGIGISCHGCCSCPAGQRARDRRKRALTQVAKLVGVKEIRDVEPWMK